MFFFYCVENKIVVLRGLFGSFFILDIEFMFNIIESLFVFVNVVFICWVRNNFK